MSAQPGATTGYHAQAMNNQTLPTLGVPGAGAGSNIGYLDALYKSSSITPSSYTVPSSINVPNPAYGQQVSPQAQQMARLLKGA